MNKTKVILPDGTTETRTSKRIYTHVVFVNFDKGGWGVSYCSSHKLAVSRANYYRNCPAAKQGANVEVIISEIIKEENAAVIEDGEA